MQTIDTHHTHNMRLSRLPERRAQYYAAGAARNLEAAARLPRSLHPTTRKALHLLHSPDRIAELCRWLRHRHRSTPGILTPAPEHFAPGAPVRLWIDRSHERNATIPILIRIERLLVPRIRPNLP